jgi:hypothetical protein
MYKVGVHLPSARHQGSATCAVGIFGAAKQAFGKYRFSHLSVISRPNRYGDVRECSNKLSDLGMQRQHKLDHASDSERRVKSGCNGMTEFALVWKSSGVDCILHTRNGKSLCYGSVREFQRQATRTSPLWVLEETGEVIDRTRPPIPLGRIDCRSW